MVDGKVEAMRVAGEYGADYWDGDRRYGYGGYSYRSGYWAGPASELIKTYGLGPGSSVLDVGCGKAFLLHELLLAEPKLSVAGLEISPHALAGATDLVRPHLSFGDARRPLPWPDQSVDLVISLAVLHNFRLPEVTTALAEIQRVGRQAFVMVESYRNEQELFNLECWALTCRTFLSVDDWLWLFENTGYLGDYEFIFFE
jgi:ubiquinone/menaquinone biosynthesis C-methylase UbiE